MTWSAKNVLSRVRDMMSVLLLSFLALGFLATPSAYCQLPDPSKKSPLNYFGRFHGIGFSDGYHSCPNNQCDRAPSWFSKASFSSYYGEPTTPPPSRFQRPAPSYAVYQPVTPRMETQAPRHTTYAYPPHATMPHSNHTVPGPNTFSYPEHSLTTPSQSLLIEDEPMGNRQVPPTPAYPQSRGINAQETLPPPQSLRPADQTRRAIPGSTRPYNAGVPGPTVRQ